MVCSTAWEKNWRAAFGKSYLGLQTSDFKEALITTMLRRRDALATAGKCQGYEFHVPWLTVSLWLRSTCMDPPTGRKCRTRCCSWVSWGKRAGSDRDRPPGC